MSGVLSKISFSTAVLHKMRHILNDKWKINLYNTYLLPFMDYCNIIWGNAAKLHLSGIRIIQKRALRFIPNAEYRAPSSF